MQYIIGAIIIFILACLAIGLILWALAFLLRYLTLPLAGIMLIVAISELIKGKKRKSNDLIITCIVFIPILCFGFWGGGKLLNWLQSSDKKDVAQKTTITETDNKSAAQSKANSAPKEEKSRVILGSTRDEIKGMFTNYEVDKKYQKDVDSNAIKFVNNDLIVVVTFDANGKAEGVSFLSSDTSGDGKNSYVNKHYDELLKLAAGGKNVKVEKDAVSKYPVEIYIGNVHD